MAIVNNTLPIHLIAAAGEWDPKLLPHLNQVGIWDVVHPLDLREGDQPGEDVGGDVVEAVTGDDGVDWEVVGNSGAVGAKAGEGNLDNLGGGNILG